MDAADQAIMQAINIMDTNQPNEQLSKREKRELKRQEKVERKEEAIRKGRSKTIINWTIGLALVALPIAGLIWYSATRPPIPETEIVARNGLHWHPTLSIYVKGVKQELPANLGMTGSSMAPVHTHDDAAQGIIHLEFQGRVLKNQITLGQFFKSWGKDIRSFGSGLTMTVNGKENTEYENYVMQDKDAIELRYE